METGFLYDTHVHTSEISRCAKNSAREQVRYYHRRGFTGIVITDHFLGCNITVPKDLPWEERVRRYCVGYEEARDEGDKLGLSVFFGWEQGYHGIDFLTYGLSPEWLLHHPEVMDYPLPTYGDFIHEHGGTVVHAHPFRESHPRIPSIELVPWEVDGVEVLNANRTDFENAAAGWFADYYGLWPCAGSDNHTGEQPRLCAIRSERKFADLDDLLNALKSREVALVTLPGKAD